jgi:hypothetical protein
LVSVRFIGDYYLIQQRVLTSRYIVHWWEQRRKVLTVVGNKQCTHCIILYYSANITVNASVMHCLFIVWAHKTSLTRHCTKPGRWEVTYLYVSTSPLSTIFLLDFGNIPTAWYFDIPYTYYFRHKAISSLSELSMALNKMIYISLFLWSWFLFDWYTDDILYALITNYFLTSNGNIEFKVIATAFLITFKC